MWDSKAWQGGKNKLERGVRQQGGRAGTSLAGKGMGSGFEVQVL